jgi:hypothetical protein
MAGLGHSGPVLSIAGEYQPRLGCNAKKADKQDVTSARGGVETFAPSYLL